MIAFKKIPFDGGLILTVSGRIELTTAPDLERELVEAVAAIEEIIIVDLSGVDYISSAGLRALNVGLSQAKAKQAKFALAALPTRVREVFAISRFDKVFTLFATVEEARNVLKPAS